MKQAHRIAFMKGMEIIVSETLDGVGIDLFVRMNGSEVLKIFGTCIQYDDLITAIDQALHSIKTRKEEDEG